MRWLLPDGVEVTGRSYAEIVKAMSDGKMAPVRSQESYRRRVAARAKEAYGAEIDDSSDRALILSMEKVQLIERLS